MEAIMCNHADPASPDACDVTCCADTHDPFSGVSKAPMRGIVGVVIVALTLFGAGLVALTHL
jgi:hypothetical protein